MKKLPNVFNNMSAQDIPAQYLLNLTAQIIELRNSANQILIFSSTTCIIILGWYFSRKIASPDENQPIYYLIVITFLILASLWQLSFLEKYLKSMAKVVKNIDNIHKAHEPGVYCVGTLLPDAWKEYGSEKWKEPIFYNGKRFLVLVECRNPWP